MRRLWGEATLAEAQSDTGWDQALEIQSVRNIPPFTTPEFKSIWMSGLHESSTDALLDEIFTAYRASVLDG